MHATIRRLKLKGVTKWPFATLFAKIRCKFPRIFANSTWVSVFHVTFVITDGGQPSNGKKHMVAHHPNLSENEYFIAAYRPSTWYSN